MRKKIWKPVLVFFKEIENHLDKDTDGYDVVLDAIDTMQRVAWHINDMKRKHEHAVRLQVGPRDGSGWRCCGGTIYCHFPNQTLRLHKCRTSLGVLSLFSLKKDQDTDNTDHCWRWLFMRKLHGNFETNSLLRAPSVTPVKIWISPGLLVCLLQISNSCCKRRLSLNYLKGFQASVPLALIPAESWGGVCVVTGQGTQRKES